MSQLNFISHSIIKYFINEVIYFLFVHHLEIELGPSIFISYSLLLYFEGKKMEYYDRRCSCTISPQITLARNFDILSLICSSLPVFSLASAQTIKFMMGLSITRPNNNCIHFQTHSIISVHFRRRHTLCV